MPANDHLQWEEIRDFTAGLWTRGDTWLMPATAAQAMQDCVPLASGGLRAFYRRQLLTGTGTNMLTPNQASVETATTGWAAGANTTIAQTTAQAADGQYSLQLTSVAAGTISSTTPTGTAGIAVAGSTQYTALASFRSAVSARSANVAIGWYTSAGSLISTSTGSNVTTTTTGFTQASVTASSPSNAAFAAVVVTVLSTGGASEVHYADKMSLAPGSSTTWAMPGTGLDPANEVFFGIFAHPTGGINPSSERYLMAWNATTHVPKLYYSTGPNTSWSVIKYFAATSTTPTIKQSFFITYLSGSTRRVVFNLNLGSTDDGIWILTGSAAPTKMTVTGGTNPSGPICVHQARIVVTDGTNIRWTDPGTETFQSANVLGVEPSGLRPANILMTSFEPSDLLIGKEAGPFILVQGDLSNPTVRALDESLELVAGGKPGLTPTGIAVAAHRDGVYTVSPGGGTEKISKSLSPNNFTLPAQFGTQTPSWIGDCFYAEGYLFTPGAIYDTATGAWFTSGNPPGNYTAAMYCYDRGTIG